MALDRLRRWFLLTLGSVFTAAMAPNKNTRCTLTLTVNNLLVTAAISAHARPGSKIARWLIEWGDGQTQEGVGHPPTLTHTYPNASTWRVMVMVWDTRGGSAWAEAMASTTDGGIIFGGGTGTTRGPQSNITCPVGAVAIAAGSTTASRQALINGNAAGTAFCLAAGVHTVTGMNIPKSGNTFCGEYGAVLDGTGWVTSDLDAAAFQALNLDVDNVTFRNLIIRNMPQKAIMGYRDFSNAWTIDYCEVYNCKTGVELPSGSILSNSKIHHCVGTAGDPNPAERGGGYSFNAIDGFSFTNNEVYNNGTEQKFILSTNITASNNYFHHNTGPGFWIDGGGSGSIVENNVSDDNVGPNIYIEIANGVIVRDNSCSRGGEGGILISVTQTSEFYRNTLTNNVFGFDLFLDCSRLSESYPPHPNPDLTNNSIHDNTIVVGSGQQAVVFTHLGGCEAPYIANTKSNNFSRNAYTVIGNGNHWVWGNGQNKTWAQWQAIPQDADGSVTIL